jgi:hypothetical protein
MQASIRFQGTGFSSRLWLMGGRIRPTTPVHEENQRGPVYWPCELTMTDLQAALGEEHQRAALRLVLSRHPNFKGPS